VNDSPLVSVLIPTLNRAAYLRAALASVRAQSHAALEILVGDNASADATPGVVREAISADRRVRSVRHAHNIGMVGNWNALSALASGDFVLVLSDDDILLPTAIERLLEPLRDPSVALSYCRVTYLNADGSIRGAGRRAPRRESGASFIRASLEGAREVWPSAMLYRRDVRVLHPYADIGTAADLLHRLALATRGDVAWIESPLVRYRVHAESLSSSYTTVRDSLRAFMRAVEQEPALDPYRARARRHVARLMRAGAVAIAVRGDLPGGRAMLEASDEFQPVTRLDRVRLRAVASPVGRLAWHARRRLRAVSGELATAGALAGAT
jgi:glycosyltransferase involved in cell wall biosynthesis